MLTTSMLAAGDPEILSIHLQRLGCFGDCPRYSISLYPDGRFKYFGEGTRVRGEVKGHYPKQRFSALVAQIGSIHFFELPEGERCGGCDSEQTVTWVETRGQAKRVFSVGFPDELMEFNRAIDAAAGLRRLVYKDGKVLQRQIQRGWDVKANGASELESAIRYDAADVIAVLAKAGFPVTGRDDFGTPYLNIAVGAGAGAAARALIARGAKLTDTDEEGRTAAVEAGGVTVAMIQLVLTAGAGVDITDERDATMLMEAASKGLLQCVTFLIERGANPNLRNPRRETALGIARKNRDHNSRPEETRRLDAVIAFLEQHGGVV